MSHARYVCPPTEEWCQEIEKRGVVAPPASATAVAPTPQQVFNVLESFPKYHVSLKRRTQKKSRKGPTQYIQIDLRREDGSYAIEIDLLQVTGDDQPALFVFAHYGKPEELVEIVMKLAEVCGPLILLHDGGEAPLVVYPPKGAHSEAENNPPCE